MVDFSMIQWNICAHGFDTPSPEANWRTPLPLRPLNQQPFVQWLTVWPMGLQKQLSRATRMYERRIEWLSLASRRIWGTVCEKRYLFLRVILVLRGFGV